MMRSFVALTLPEAATQSLISLQSGLPFGRPVAPENLHVTLAFLGDQPEELIGELHYALCAISLARFTLRLTGPGTFGNREPKLMFAGVEDNAELTALHKKIRTSLRACGLTLGRERFRPHVTLTRFSRRPSPVECERLQAFLIANATFSLGPIPANQFTLFRSTLQAGGPIYEELATYNLG